MLTVFIFIELSCLFLLTLFKFICPFKYPVFHIIMIDMIGKSFFRSDFIFIDRLDHILQNLVIKCSIIRND